MANVRVTTNRKALIAELTADEPILKRVAEEVFKEAFFEPAVEQLKADFEGSAVTQEIAGGLGAANISDTLDGEFRDAEGDTIPNLWGFIGFDADTGGPAEQLAPIRIRLDPRHPDGPKMVYRGRPNRDKLTYAWDVQGPDMDAIYADTGLPWADGISWVKRIEVGLPGIGHFLNVAGRPSSRSGGGIQIEGQLRSGRFKPTSYLSRMVNDFLRRATGRTPNGRSI